MGEIQTTEELDEVIKEAARDIGIWSILSPTNEEVEKRRFLNNSNIQRPNFHYAEPDLEKLYKHQKNLEHANIPVWESQWVKDTYRSSIEQYLDWIEIAKNVGEDPKKVRDLTIGSFGKPREEDDDFDLLEVAWDILVNGYDIENEYEGSGETYTAEEVQERFRKLLRREGLIDDWSVVSTNKGSFRVSSANKLIVVPDGREYTDNEIYRLPIHEGGGHVFRAANGYNQPYQVLGVGTGGYMEVEEGITTTLEELTGSLDSGTMEKYASRVLAVQSVLDGDSFRETYEMLREGYHLDEDDAWDRTMRAHRGGGCIKDHVYLKGKIKVQQHLEEGGDLKYLMMGKTDLEDQEEMERLVEENTLVAPTYNPSSLVEGEAEERLQEIW